jgi:glutathione S-transferase
MPDRPVATIHHMERSRSKRIVWLMEELGVPYRLERYRRGPDLLAQSDYRALHPFAHAPVVTDGDLVLIESGAIVELLLERYGAGRLAPLPGTFERARYLQWLHFAEGSAMANQTAERIAAGGSPARQIFTTRNEEMLRYLDAELSTRPYLAGADFTAADIMMEFPLAYGERVLGRSLVPYPNVVAFHRRIASRPAFARATAQVGDTL